MVDNPAWEICERVAEVQALLDDHMAGGKHSAADVIAKAQRDPNTDRDSSHSQFNQQIIQMTTFCTGSKSSLAKLAREDLTKSRDSDGKSRRYNLGIGDYNYRLPAH